MIRKARIENEELRVFQDENPESPREWDNLGKMVCFHERHSLGDTNEFSSPEDFDEFLKENKVISLPLYLYEHGGITISTKPFSCPWDSGQIGYIYVTHKRILEEWSKKRISKQLRQKVINNLQCEVEVYDQYLRGEVYGFELVKLTKCDQGEEHEETLDGVWGFYGYNIKENGILDHIDEKWKDVEFKDVN